MATFDALMRSDAQRIAQALGIPIDEARREVQRLLCHACNVSRAWLLAHGSETVGDKQRYAYDAVLSRRLSGEPLAYIRGYQAFYGLRFAVDASVLIPRSDTELLVETALSQLAPEEAATVLDLGTGSGIVAISIAHHRPHTTVTAVDISTAALALAQRNAAAMNLSNIRFVNGDWFLPLAQETFKLITANPPYVRDDDPHLADLSYEPRSALCAGSTGMDALQTIIREAPRFLSAGGMLAVEHGFDQGQACRSLFEAAGFGHIETARDLGGNERVTSGRCVRLSRTKHPP